MAPMAELSHRALRELIHGFLEGKNLPETPVYFTEMISAPGLLAGGPLEKWYLDSGPDPHRLVYQLLGTDTDQLVKAAALLDRRDCLGIDINMGCSAPAITRTGAGVRWMEGPEKAARLIEKIRRVTKKQLSVKIRLGPKKQQKKGQNSYNGRKMPGGEMAIGETAGGKSPDFEGLEQLPYLIEFCRGMEAAGLDLITLHPRMAEEKFKRRSRWEYVYALRKELGIPVAGNGDIDSTGELAQKAASGPVMAGRLLVREPWAFAAVLESNPAQISAISADKDEIEETGLHFLELLEKYQPPEFYLSRARRFFRYYCDNLHWAEYMRNKINRQESLAGIEQVWREYFSLSNADSP
ncbi:MAG: tRNA-dihydrouridine synthase family protein [Spirochaetaceae bacterium]|nr:tRNA-dihydrouridine synthase family protein [Spirochaetaceae bacterium]